MKICFVGLGSIARRHIKNLIEVLEGTNFSIDVFRSSKRELPSDVKDFIDQVYYSFDELPYNYDVIFITNPTKLHFETLKQAEAHGKNFFIEKPVFETGEENIEDLHLSTDKKYYVACPLRYTNVIQYVKEHVDFSKINSIRAISSSYLPDWRPGQDYRETYSAKKSLGGGVSIDLIHEWDYISFLIGFPKKVYSIISKKSSLEIDSDDIAIYIAEYEGKTVELHLDYFGRKTIRELEIFTADDTIAADLVNSKITYLLSGKTVDLSEERNDFQKKELRHFFEIVAGKIENDNTIEDSMRVLRLTRGIDS